MLEEETYWNYIELWAIPENREAIAKELSKESPWWIACFTVDLYTKHGQDDTAKFCEMLMRISEKEKQHEPQI